MIVRRKVNGKCEVRVVMGGQRVGRTFDRKGDADQYDTWLNRRKQLGDAAPPEKDMTLAEFVAVYWRFYAVPNLSDNTRGDHEQVWGKHLQRGLGRVGCASSRLGALRASARTWPAPALAIRRS